MTKAKAAAAPATDLPQTVNGRELAGILQPAGGPLEGLEDEERPRPPQLLISYDDDSRGQFKIGRKGEPAKEVRCVILKRHKYRELLENVGTKFPARTCMAVGLEHPHPGVREPKDRSCRDCEWGKWQPNPANPEGKNIAPKCQIGQALLGVWVDRGHSPFWYAQSKWWHAAAIQERFVDPVHAWNGQHGPDEQIGGLFDFEVVMTTERTVNGGIAFYKPQFSLTRMDDKRRAFYREIYGVVKELSFVPWMEGVEDAVEDVTPVVAEVAPDDPNSPPF